MSTNRIKCTLTEKFIQSSADALISDLKIKLAGAEEYIKELEDKLIVLSQLINDSEEVSQEYKDSVSRLFPNSEEYILLLTNANKDLKSQLKKVNNKYSKDKQQLLLDPIIQEYHIKNQTLKKEIEQLIETRNNLIYKLHERNN